LAFFYARSSTCTAPCRVPDDWEGPTDGVVTTKARLQQQRFRDAVLAAMGAGDAHSRACGITRLLEATAHRAILEGRDGVCEDFFGKTELLLLSTLHRLFDRGLITFFRCGTPALSIVCCAEETQEAEPRGRNETREASVGPAKKRYMKTAQGKVGASITHHRVDHGCARALRSACERKASSSARCWLRKEATVLGRAVPETFRHRSKSRPCRSTSFVAGSGS